MLVGWMGVMFGVVSLNGCDVWFGFGSGRFWLDLVRFGLVRPIFRRFRF